MNSTLSKLLQTYEMKGTHVLAEVTLKYLPHEEYKRILDLCCKASGAEKIEEAYFPDVMYSLLVKESHLSLSRLDENKWLVDFFTCGNTDVMNGYEVLKPYLINEHAFFFIYKDADSFRILDKRGDDLSLKYFCFTYPLISYLEAKSVCSNGCKTIELKHIFDNGSYSKYVAFLSKKEDECFVCGGYAIHTYKEDNKMFLDVWGDVKIRTFNKVKPLWKGEVRNHIHTFFE